MNEKQLEKLLTTATRKAGGHAYKLISPNHAGMPDRLICLPGGKIGFIELKAPGNKARPLQEHRIKELKTLGFYARVLDSPHDIQDTLNEIQTT